LTRGASAGGASTPGASTGGASTGGVSTGGASTRGAWTRRAQGAVAAAVVLVGLAGGAGAGAAVQALDRAGAWTPAGDRAALAAADPPDRNPTHSRSEQRGAGSRLVPGMGRSSGGATDDARTRETSSVDPASAGGSAEDLTSAADLAEAAEGVAQGVSGDVRPLPVPTLLAPGTVGPVWLSPTDRADGLLSVDVPESGSGVLDVVPGSSPAPGAAPVRTVRVEVEQGLPVDSAAFAAMVMTTLNDPRGWGAHGEVTFARTDGPADLRVVLATPTTVDSMCAPLRTDGEVSCGTNGHAALNFRRWVEATDEFADRHQYREYLVNHEVGHLLGHRHESCPGPGQPAPLMQQQSYAVAPCTPNGWPFP
jgi:hypothetical protein